MTDAWPALVKEQLLRYDDEREVRILAGAKGWYVVEPEPDGAVRLYGPMLSVGLAYMLLEEAEAVRACRAAYVRELLKGAFG